MILNAFCWFYARFLADVRLIFSRLQICLVDFQGFVDGFRLKSHAFLIHVIYLDGWSVLVSRLECSRARAV